MNKKKIKSGKKNSERTKLERVKKKTDNELNSDDENFKNGILYVNNISDEDDNEENKFKFIDEEIDSDEALGSEDGFDFFITESSNKKNPNQANESNSNQNLESDIDENSFSDGSNVITLSQLLDINLKKDENQSDKLKTQENEVLDENESESLSEEETVNDDFDDDFTIFESDTNEDDNFDLKNTISSLKKKIEAKDVETNKFEKYDPSKNETQLSLKDMLSTVDTSLSADAFLINTKKKEESSKILDVSIPVSIKKKIDRSASYAISKKKIDSWKDTVSLLRQSEVLKFPLEKEHNVVSESIFCKTEAPKCDKLNNINQLLSQSIVSNGDKEKDYESELMDNFTIDEMKKKRNELRLLRELTFREELKRKRIKKIKSKQFRKINRKSMLKQKMLIEGSDFEDEEDLNYKRALERMTLKHKMLSRWAKSLVQSGLSKDASNRSELEEMLKYETSLKKKQLDYKNDNDSYDSITEIENEYIKESNENDIKKKAANGLFEMKFMKDADDELREKNKKDLLKLKKLENHTLNVDYESDSKENEIIGKRSYSKIYNEDNEGVDNTILEQKIETFDTISNNKKDNETFDTISDNKKDNETFVEKKSDTHLKNVNVNPWLSITTGFVNSGPEITDTNTEEKSNKENNNIKINTRKKKKKDKDILINTNENQFIHEHLNHGAFFNDRDEMILSQKSLVKEAFAGDNVMDEFILEKEQIQENDDDKTIDLTLPGWGSWIGKDKKFTRNKVVKKVMGIKKSKRKDFNLKDVIINEKSIKKSLKFQCQKIPHNFSSKFEYESYLKTPLGKEWNSRSAHQKLITPLIIVKQGEVIHPLKKTIKI